MGDGCSVPVCCSTVCWRHSMVELTGSTSSCASCLPLLSSAAVSDPVCVCGRTACDRLFGVRCAAAAAAAGSGCSPGEKWLTSSATDCAPRGTSGDAGPAAVRSAADVAAEMSANRCATVPETMSAMDGRLC